MAAGNISPGAWSPSNLEIPAYVPQDLLSDADRIINNSLESALWIRTWYGDSDASQEQADAGYARVYLHAIQQDDDTEPNESIPEAFMFTDKAGFGAGALHGDSLDSDIVDGVALAEAGSLPWYVVTAMMHCPDQLVNRSGKLRPEADLAVSQRILVAVVDRKACEDGWVLMFALNHKGEILPFRVRNRAYYVDMTLTGLLGNGEALEEMSENPDADEEVYVEEGDGWLGILKLLRSSCVSKAERPALHKFYLELCI